MQLRGHAGLQAAKTYSEPTRVFGQEGSGIENTQTIIYIIFFYTHDIIYDSIHVLKSQFELNIVF